MKGLSSEQLLVNVDRIPDEGVIIKSRVAFDRFPGVKDLCREEAVLFLSPIRLKIQLRRVSRFVETAGSLQTSVRLSCSRCLGDYSHSLTVDFGATFTKTIPAPDAPQEEADVELTAESIDLFQFHGKEIDLTEAIQEQILLSLPLRPLCQEECKGLCSRCGEDLNKRVCGCGGKAVDPRLAVLEGLKLKK